LRADELLAQAAVRRRLRDGRMPSNLRRTLARAVRAVGYAAVSLGDRLAASA
jgi:hypothetical protein